MPYFVKFIPIIYLKLICQANIFFFFTSKSTYRTFTIAYRTYTMQITVTLTNEQNIQHTRLNYNSKALKNVSNDDEDIHRYAQETPNTKPEGVTSIREPGMRER